MSSPDHSIKRAFTKASLVAVCLIGGSAAMGAAACQGTAQASLSPASSRGCPSETETANALRTGSEAIATGRSGDAIPMLQTLAGTACNPQISLLLAAAYEGNSDIPKALEALQRAHEVWPANGSISASLARLYLGTAQPAKAAETLVRFHPSDTTPQQEIDIAVLAFLGSQQLPAAEAAARVGYRAHPSIPSLLLLANTLQLEGRYKDVITMLANKRGEYGASPPFLVTLAQSEYDASMFDVARVDIEGAIALDSSLYPAHYLLGNLLLKVGSPTLAEAEYRIAVQLSPNQPRTYYYLALALRAEHKESEEKPLLAKAIEIDEQYALARCEMGRILLNEDRVPEAEAQLTQAVQQNASNEQGYYLLARAYQREGKSEQAEEMARKLAEVRRANHSSQGKPQSMDAGTSSPAS